MALVWCPAGIALSLALSLASSAQAAGANLYRFDTGLWLGEARLLESWWHALQRNQQQDAEFDQCLENVNICSGHLRVLRQLVLKGRDLEEADRLELVNRYLNRRKYSDDRQSNNASSLQSTKAAKRHSAALTSEPRSHWSTLYEFLQRGGDCEDYASSKYFLLRRLGIEPDRMRVVVARERNRRGHHAVLAYQWPDGAVWLLESDNIIKKRSHIGYRYVYALNERGIWDYRMRPSQWDRTQPVKKRAAKPRGDRG